MNFERQNSYKIRSFHIFDKIIYLSFNKKYKEFNERTGSFTQLFCTLYIKANRQKLFLGEREEGKALEEFWSVLRISPSGSSHCVASACTDSTVYSCAVCILPHGPL